MIRYIIKQDRTSYPFTTSSLIDTPILVPETPWLLIIVCNGESVKQKGSEDLQRLMVVGVFFFFEEFVNFFFQC